jgi:hypothetical protein
MARLGDTKKQDRPGENAHPAPAKRKPEADPAPLDKNAGERVLKPERPAEHLEKGRPKSTGRWGA